jgi:hypothetical protein
VTDSGIISDDNDEHHSKQYSPRDATDSGIVSDANDEHQKKWT